MTKQTDRKPERFGHPRKGGASGELQTQYHVRTPRFRCNAPLVWLMWTPNPKASAVHHPNGHAEAA